METAFEASEHPRRMVGGLSFTVLPLNEATSLVRGMASQPSEPGVAVHFANAYNIALADSDPAYRDLINHAPLVFTDGTPVVWAGRRLHPDVADRWGRVYGPDVMEAVLGASNLREPRHYLLGGSPETLVKLKVEIAARWPNARIVGAESPPFRPASPEELKARDERIRTSQATCVWVGLGTPKQDVEVERLASSLPVVAVAVGAAFDFISGSVSQAPRWMQRSGFEWAYRLGREPRRLAKRYLWGNPKFVLAVVRQSRRQGAATARN